MTQTNVREATIMQNPTSLLNTSAVHQFKESVRRFFDISTEQPRLLNRQPLAQRQLFLKKAVASHFIVFVQLRPQDGSTVPTNIQGVIHQFDDRHYLISRGHVNFVFTIDQLQYLARL
jgi:hypothetical protein